MSPTCTSPSYSAAYPAAGGSLGEPRRDVPVFDGWIWMDATAAEFTLPPERLIEIGNSESLVLDFEVTATGTLSAIATLSAVVERTAASTDQAEAWTGVETLGAGEFGVGRTSLARTYGPRSPAALPMPRGLVRVRLASTPSVNTHIALRLRLWATLS